MMNIRNTIKTAVEVGIRQWRITLTVYVFQFFLVLTLGMQVYQVLDASIGQSLEINKLLRQYDHTVLTDFLRIHGASITPLIGQLRWLVLAWLLFSVFIHAGMLACSVAPGETSARVFWTNGAVYFFPFLKISLFFFLLAFVWTALLWAPVALALMPALENFPSEQYVVWPVIFLVAGYLAGLAVLFLWSVVSRLYFIKTHASALKNLRSGWRILVRNRGPLLRLMTIFTGFHLVLIALYWLLEGISGMTSPVWIVVFFGVQQVFIFFRIQLRQLLYTAIGYAVQ